MKKFIKTYKNTNEENINYELIRRELDDDLVYYIVDCCKSLEVLQYIKFLGYEYITNEADINTSDYIYAKSRSKQKKKDQVKYMYIQDSRYAELILKFKLECNDEVDIITKKILIPVPDENNYYKINGNKYFLMYQIVDNSTYTTKSSMILKSMMPVIIKLKQVTNKNVHETKSIEGESYTAPVYTINVFKNDINIMVFYLAKLGLEKTLKYFSVDKIMGFVDNVEKDTDTFIYFSINSKLYMKVNKHMFTKFIYVKTITFMFLVITTNRLTMENLLSKSYWIEYIGAIGSTNKLVQYEKGLNTLISFDRIIDDTTKKILKVHPINKMNIYSILRWMIQNFPDLRRKDNLDLGNKRLRCNECIASLLTKVFNERVNRIIALGSKATLSDVKKIFKFPGDVIISRLHKSGLLRYDDTVNDLDFYLKLRVTQKGPNSLGNNNENNIAAKFRGIDTSHLGRLDINVCGTSDPGTSSVLVPTVKTHGLYFDKKNEPESFKRIFDKYIDDNILKDDDCLNISPIHDNDDDYYNLIKYNKELGKKFSINKIPTKDDLYTIDINIFDEIEF